MFVIEKGRFRDKQFIKPLYEPENFERFFHNTKNEKELIYIPKGEKPNSEILDHLSKYSEIMEDRRENKKGSIEFFNLHWPREEGFFNKGPEIISLRKCINHPLFAYSDAECYVMLSFNIISVCL